MENNSSLTWKSVAVSVTGAKHERRGEQGEDASIAKSIGDHLEVVALSDGHGSDKVPHSHTGAQFAVKSAVEVIEDTANGIRIPEDSDSEDDEGSESGIWDLVMGGDDENTASQGKGSSPVDAYEDVFRREMEGNSRLVRRVIGRWREKVKTREAEKQGDVGEDDFSGYDQYGATLLVAVVGRGYRFFFQIGDGDIVSLPRECEGESAERESFWVFPHEDESVGEETYSLSMQSPERYSETKFISSRKSSLSKNPFLLLCTDGYRNSFVNDDDFLEAVREFRDFFLSPQVGEALSGGHHESIEGVVKEWLEDTSDRGSGDDISLGALFDSAYSGTTETDLIS
jgi:serine/threonine protein phosphatase PrpC